MNTIKTRQVLASHRYLPVLSKQTLRQQLQKLAQWQLLSTPTLGIHPMNPDTEKVSQNSRHLLPTQTQWKLLQNRSAAATTTTNYSCYQNGHIELLLNQLTFCEEVEKGFQLRHVEAAALLLPPVCVEWASCPHQPQFRDLQQTTRWEKLVDVDDDVLTLAFIQRPRHHIRHCMTLYFNQRPVGSL
jgi:hypothetical protein